MPSAGCDALQSTGIMPTKANMAFLVPPSRVPFTLRALRSIATEKANHPRKVVERWRGSAHGNLVGCEAKENRLARGNCQCGRFICRAGIARADRRTGVATLQRRP